MTTWQTASKLTTTQRKLARIQSYPLWTVITPGTPEPERFDFNAKDEQEANDLARAWGRRHGLTTREEVIVQRATRTAATNMWHNEYVDFLREGRDRL
jgi:hypothetical protein